MVEQICWTCKYYCAEYFECEHPEQIVTETGHKRPEDGDDCELWADGGERRGICNETIDH